MGRILPDRTGAPNVLLAKGLRFRESPMDSAGVLKSDLVAILVESRPAVSFGGGRSATDEESNLSPISRHRPPHSLRWQAARRAGQAKHPNALSRRGLKAPPLLEPHERAGPQAMRPVAEYLPPARARRKNTGTSLAGC